jgi:hypothetical protein
MIINWKGYGRRESWPNLRYYPGILLEGLRRTMKTIKITGLWVEI